MNEAETKFGERVFLRRTSSLELSTCWTTRNSRDCSFQETPKHLRYFFYWRFI